MSADVEVVVVGAGVVGLAVGRSLSARGHEVMVLERHERVGSETSSRNSEVIHAGLYYSPGSLRTRMCVAGKKLLYQFADDNGVAVARCGKLVVATGEAEVPALERLMENAHRSGVCDLQRLSAAEARAREPALACVAAFHSPSTGVVDSHGLMLALEGHIDTNGGQVVLNTQVNDLAYRATSGLYRVSARSGGEVIDITAKRVVIASGLGATEVADMLFGAPGASNEAANGYVPPRTTYAKGHYFTLSGKAPFSQLIYPLPSAAWLGVHLTLDIAGQAKFGPDLMWCDGVDYAFDEDDGARQAAFEATIRRFWPALPDRALQPGYVGVRPKIYREGEPTADFAIHGPDMHASPGLIALYGIESPGLTSSLAIGEHVANLMAELG